MNTTKNKTQVAIFDFCGTFVNFQTGDAFIRYVLGCKKDDVIADCNASHRNVVHKIHDIIFPTPLSKILLARKIKGVKTSMVEEKASKFATNLLFPNVIKETYSLFEKCKENNMFIVLVSAAYGVYLKEFAKKVQFDAILSSELGTKKGVMTGKIIDDTIGTRKVRKIKKYLARKFGRDGYSIELSVGDSKSDVPILDLAKKAIVVSKKHQAWLKDNYEEITYGY